MHRINKMRSRKGFTFVEILLVVAIIVILAGAFTISANDLLNKSRAASGKVAQSSTKLSQSLSASEQKLKGYGF